MLIVNLIGCNEQIMKKEIIIIMRKLFYYQYIFHIPSPINEIHCIEYKQHSDIYPLSHTKYNKITSKFEEISSCNNINIVTMQFHDILFIKSQKILISIGTLNGNKKNEIFICNLSNGIGMKSEWKPFNIKIPKNIIKHVAVNVFDTIIIIFCYDYNGLNEQKKMYFLDLLNINNGWIKSNKIIHHIPSKTFIF